MVYVISAEGTLYVKIGVAKNPIARLLTLQTGIPQSLVLVAYADWPNSSERRIHRVLKQQRVRGEWYQHSPEVDRLIKHMQSGSPDVRHWLATFQCPPRLARVLAISR